MRHTAVWLLRMGLLLALVGCSRLGIQQESITLDTVFPAPNRTDVTVSYSLPPPPVGKTYVVWVVNPNAHRAVRAGVAPPGRDQVVKATVDFEATGAVISVEGSANPSTMGDVWALKVGTVTPGLATPTPDPLRLTPTPGVGPTGTPAATPAP